MNNLLSLKRKKLFLSLLVGCFLFAGGNVWGQVNIVAGTPYSQDFNGIGTTATASLPTGWRMENIAGVRTVTAAYSNVSGTATTVASTWNTAMANNASNGRYNFGGSSATDRAIGGLSSQTASQSVNMYLQLKNAGTSDISSFTINYDAERFRNGQNIEGFSIRFYYSTTGLANSWIEVPNLIASFSANGDNNGATTNPMETKNVSYILNQALSANSSIYFVWSYSVTSGTTTSSAQALGIDNIVITGIEAQPCAAPPATPATGTHTPTIGAAGTANNSQILWKWTGVSCADEYFYNTVDNFATATSAGTATQFEQTGLAAGATYTLYVWAKNTFGTSGSVELTQAIGCKPVTITAFSQTTPERTIGAQSFTQTTTIATGAGSIQYSGNNPAVATVNALTGEVTFLAMGVVTVTADVLQAGEYCAATQTRSYTLTVTCNSPFNNYSITPRTESISTGSCSYKVANIQTLATITYQSSNPAVATVDGNGIVLFLTPGTTTITASCPADGTYCDKTSSNNLTITPVNDLCANAASLACGTPTAGILSGTTPTTAITYSNYSDKNDVFYSFTAQYTGEYIIKLSNFSSDKELYLYSNCSSTTALKSSATTNSTETITYDCTAGTPYIVRIADYTGNGGTFDISLTCPTPYNITLNPGAGTVSETSLPDVITVTLPDAVPVCDGDGWEFAGWVEDNAVEEMTTLPNFVSKTYKPTKDVTLFAVYKKTESSGVISEQSFTISTSTITDIPTSYGDHTWTQNEVTFRGNKIVFQNNAGTHYIQMHTNSSGAPGHLYNTTAIDNLKSITINRFSTNNTILTVYEGNASNPLTTSAGTLSGSGTINFGSGVNYFTIAVGGMVQMMNITIKYEAATNTVFYNSNPICIPLTVELTGVGILDNLDEVNFGTVNIHSTSSNKKAIKEFEITCVTCASDVSVELENTAGTAFDISNSSGITLKSTHDAGKTVEVTFEPAPGSAPYDFVALLTFSSPGAEPFVVKLSGSAVDLPTGIDNISVAGIKTYADNGRLIIETSKAARVEVFTVDGMQVVAKTIDGRESFTLPKGVYLVKTGSGTDKVVL